MFFFLFLTSLFHACVPTQTPKLYAFSHCVLYLFPQICCSFVGVSGDYTATVELRRYQNPTHMRAQSNDCCDGDCEDPCDNRFRFCYFDSPDVAQRAAVLQVRPEEAVIGCQFATELVGKDNDNITFPNSGIIGNSVRNPLRFKGDVWPVRQWCFNK